MEERAMRASLVSTVFGVLVSAAAPAMADCQRDLNRVWGAGGFSAADQQVAQTEFNAARQALGAGNERECYRHVDRLADMLRSEHRSSRNDDRYDRRDDRYDRRDDRYDRRGDRYDD